MASVMFRLREPRAVVPLKRVVVRASLQRRARTAWCLVAGSREPRSCLPSSASVRCASISHDRASVAVAIGLREPRGVAPPMNVVLRSSITPAVLDAVTRHSRSALLLLRRRCGRRLSWRRFSCHRRGQAGYHLWPNPAVERTCRGSASFLCEPRWRHAAHLDR